MTISKSPKNLGFTLIELLVVISIISLLSSIVMSSINNARAKGRDAQRIRTLWEIRTALQMYYSDNGYYPNCGGNNVCSSNGYGGAISTLGVVPQYIKSIPNDPINTSTTYGYYYARKYTPTSKSTAIWTDLDLNFILSTRLERGNNTLITVNGGQGWDNPNLNYLIGQ
jgi:prepilin-type N-terminal cleavage/methylation domain-containing protein